MKLFNQETTYSEKELNVKAKLEDLIDQVIKTIDLCFKFLQFGRLMRYF